MATVANPRLPEAILCRLRAWVADPLLDELRGCSFQAIAVYMATGALMPSDPALLKELALGDFGFTQQQLDARRAAGEMSARALANEVIARGPLTARDQERLEAGATQCFWCARVAPPGVCFHHCQRCRPVTYCDAGCQRAHWPQHRALCGTPATQPASAQTVAALLARGDF